MEHYVPSELDASTLDAPNPFPEPYQTARVMELKPNTRVGNFVDYSLKQLEQEPLLLFKGAGDSAEKAVACVEVLKRRTQRRLYQWNALGYGTKTTYWDPTIDGLDRLRVRIDERVMFILVSTQPFPPEHQCLSMQSSDEPTSAFATVSEDMPAKPKLTRKKGRSQWESNKRAQPKNVQHFPYEDEVKRLRASEQESKAGGAGPG